MLNWLRCGLLLLLAVLPVGAAVAGTRPAQVMEVSMAAPDIVHVEIRDPEFLRGGIVKLDGPRREPNGTWVRHEGKWGLVIGPARDHLRLADTPPDTFLDRARVDETQGYGQVGGRNVVSVHRKSMPYDSGLFPASNGDTRAGASFRHDIYLKLDGPLPPGSHVIGWPGAVLADTAFDLDDRKIRASSVHVTQNGHRRGDLAKTAYLSLWLPGGPHHGSVDFREYGIDGFEVIDASGQQVFAGPLRLRSGDRKSVV